MQYIDHLWTGSPGTMADVLTALGWTPDGAEPTQPRHPAIAGFAPVAMATDVAGVPAWTVLIRATEALPLPEGVQLAPQWVADVLVGRIAAESPRTISARAFFDRFTREERVALRAQPILDDAERGAIAQGSVHLDSPEAAALLALAVQEQVLTPERVAQILA